MAQKGGSLNLSRWWGEVRDWFIEQPSPRSSFYLTSSYICGLSVEAKNKKVINTFIHPLKKELVTPSFQRENLKNREALKEILDKGLKKLSCSGCDAAILLPELSQKVFIFTFDALPTLKNDVEKLLYFSLKKKIPILPKDLRMSYHSHNYGEKVRVVTAVSRSCIIREYEDFFNSQGLKVGIVAIPVFSLSRLLDSQWSGLLVNIEEEVLSCLAYERGEILIYRQKPLKFSSDGQENEEQKIENIVQEIETTNRFLEDREKKRMSQMTVRLGGWKEEDQLYERIKQRIPISIQKIESLVNFDLPPHEFRLLSPLIGQIV